LLAFFGFLNIYCLRVNLSVALVAMVNHTSIKPYYLVANDTEKLDNCGNSIEEQKKTKQVLVRQTETRLSS